jgi:DNA-binding LytR/AlgR family response regulator
MIRIAIVEDEAMYAQQLADYLQQYGEENGETFAINVFSDGDEIVHNYKAKFDIILMDIEMKLMDGMSAAEEIRKVDTEVGIIFITNMPQYAIRGYAVDALDYVLKPVSYFAFSQRLSRAISRSRKDARKMMILNVRGGMIRLDISNIYYIESQGHNLIVHAASGHYESPGVMKEAEEKLAESNFYRGNKGYLINLAHVDGVQEGCAVVHGEMLVLSRSRKKDFMTALNHYWGDVLK